MAFYKKIQMAINKKWYPQSCLVGNPVTTDQIAKRLAAESTVAPADVKAVLEALSGVMGDYMAQGHSVRLDGIGSFFFQSQASGNGKDKAEDVSADSSAPRVPLIALSEYRCFTLRDFYSAPMIPLILFFPFVKIQPRV